MYNAQYHRYELFTVNNQNAIGLPVGTANVERIVSLLCKMRPVPNIESDLTAKLNPHNDGSVFVRPNDKHRRLDLAVTGSSIQGL